MLNWRSALIVLSAFLSASCSDPVEPTRPAAAVAITSLSQNVPAGTAVPTAPSVRVTTAGGRPLEGVRVMFAVQSGGGSLTDPDQRTDVDGVARAGSWTVGVAPGMNSVRATIEGLPDADLVFEAIALPDGCSTLVMLDMPLGDFARLKGPAATTYPCLLFDPAVPEQSEYVLLIENMSPTGTFNGALFPGPAGDTSLAYTMDVIPLDTAAVADGNSVRISRPDAGPFAHGEYTWDFGAGRLREHTPDLREIAALQREQLRGGWMSDVNGLDDSPTPGDTIQVLLEGIPRLGINTGMQKAVIRHVSDDLIIAEDVRLGTTLYRPGGGFNTPIPEADLAEIAAEYSAVARVQGDLFFNDRHNSAVDARTPRRVTAVHSLMPAEGVWGYTYSVTNYFVWDYWVATDGATKSLNQHPQRIADNLFMHEIAHMRHFGLMQHNGIGIERRGNRWLVEGFARFAERMPIASRLLGSTAPSRTGNIVLPRNPVFNNAYFLDDVPTYLNAGSSMYFGYQTSSFVFDYFADQVAASGGDWASATREFVLAGGTPADLDAAVDRWLPGTTFADLFTRARIALYTDDIGTPDLPPWTQYHQFRLRESRPAPMQLAGQDPRAQWMRASLAVPVTIDGEVAAGAATGFIIDASNAGAALVRVVGPAGANARLSIARIR